MADNFTRHSVRYRLTGLAMLVLLMVGGCDPARENQKRIAEENGRLRFPVDASCHVIVDFERNSDQLDGHARRMIRFAGRRAMSNKSRKAAVVGYYADGESNLLAERRARAVVDRLKGDGVPVSMIPASVIGDFPPSSPTAAVSICSGGHN